MELKTLVWLGVFVGSALGGWIGSLLGNGNFLSWQGLLGSTIGAFAGIYAAYKFNQRM